MSVQVVTATPPLSPFPVRPLLRLAAAAIGAALLVAAIGWVLQSAFLGVTESAARARVERDVRATFDQMSQELKLRASTAALADPALVARAAVEDEDAAARLFAAAREGITAGGETSDAALTVFAPDGTPLAWAGRPSELPSSRLAGAETYFFSSTPLGPRLVYIRPVGTSTSRTGTIAAERSVVPAGRLTAGGSLRLRAASADSVNLATRLAVVTIRPATGVAPSPLDADTFQVASPAGGPLITASVSSDDLRATRERWRRATWSLSLLTFAIALILLVGPMLDWRNRSSRRLAYLQATLSVAVVVVAARVIARMASPADWSDMPVFSSAEYAGTLLGPLLTSPFDFLLTAGAAGALTGLLLFAVEAWRLVGWRHRRAVSSASARLAYLSAQVVAGFAVAAVVSGHQELLRNTIANTTLDLLRFSLIEWNTPRLALQLGLVLAHATAIGLAVAILRLALARWSVPTRNWQLRAATVACWIAPLVIWRFIVERQLNEQLPLLASAVLITLLALYGTRLMARFRRPRVPA